MGTYLKPVTGNYAVSCSWQCHKDRNPPSGEPGTDYPADYGTPALAPEAGKVIEIKKDNSGAMGRYVAIRLDDGRDTRCLHLSAVSVSVGQRVTRGQTIGKVGGSGYGDDRYYGTHLHQTLWPHQMWDDATIDFAKHVGALSLEPDQRQVKSNAPANGREEPTTQSPLEGDPLPAGTVGNFDGWINGQEVEQNGTKTKVWYRGISGRWFWAGGFTSQSTSGLADLNPSSLLPHQRLTLMVVNGRAAPTTESEVNQTIGADVVCDFDGWTHGESVTQSGTTSDIWFRGEHSGDWFWIGGFTPKNTTGLEEIADPETPAAPQPPDSADPPYGFEPFDDVVTAVMPAARSNLESPQRADALPYTGVVLHDYGTFGVDSFEGTVAWFQNPDSETSAHFVVSGVEIVQMVALEDRAFHAGPDGNGFIGIEIDPVVGQPDGTPGRSETITSVNALLFELDSRYTLERRKHSEFMQTSCGDDIDVDLYAPAAPNRPDDAVPVSTATLRTWRDEALSLSRSIDAVLDQED